MMIECPRCGFAQPKDQYCASCGVNMDAILAKPKPFLVRLFANPNFHLSLIGALIVAVVGWIFYTQSAMVSREVGRMLDLPVSSRHAGDPRDSEAENAAASKAVALDAAEDSAEEDSPEPMAAGAVGTGETRTPEEILAAAVGAPPPANAKSAAAADPTKLELSYWEIPREALAGLVANAQRLAEGTAGRAYYWPQGTKVLETLQTTGQSLGSGRSANLAANAQITHVTAPTAPEMFQFSIAVQIGKLENKEAALNWAVNFVLPQPEPPGQSGPAMRQVLEGSLGGQGTLAPQGVIMLLMDPPNRGPREEYMAKAGEGPWNTIFKSPEYRTGITDWVMVLQLK